MSKVTLAEIGWTEFVRENLQECMDRASQTLADMTSLEHCDGADCGRIFDVRDKRSMAVKCKEDGLTYRWCPGCEGDILLAEALQAIETAMKVIELPAPELKETAVQQCADVRDCLRARVPPLPSLKK